MDARKEKVVKYFVSRCTKYDYDKLQEEDIAGLYENLIISERCPDEYKDAETEEKIYCPRLCLKVDNIPIHGNVTDRHTCEECWIRSEKEFNESKNKGDE